MTHTRPTKRELQALIEFKPTPYTCAACGEKKWPDKGAMWQKIPGIMRNVLVCFDCFYHKRQAA